MSLIVLEKPLILFAISVRTSSGMIAKASIAGDVIISRTNSTPAPLRLEALNMLLLLIPKPAFPPCPLNNDFRRSVPPKYSPNSSVLSLIALNPVRALFAAVIASLLSFPSCKANDRSRGLAAASYAVRVSVSSF